MRVYAKCIAVGIFALCAVSLGPSAALAAPVANNPVPLINQPLVPDAVAPGGPAFTLTVHGSGFVAASVVRWDGSARATTFVSSSTLAAAILASDIAVANTSSVTVVSPAPGGGTSNVAFLQVSAPVSALIFNRTDLAAGTQPFFVAPKDLNGDGILDLVVLNAGESMLAVYLGKGDGTFQPPVDYATGSGPSWVGFGDFNGDGKLDLAVADTSDDTISILLGNGDGTFGAPTSFPAVGQPEEVIAADLKGDGKLDLVAPNANGGGGLSVYIGNGDGTFQSGVTYAAGFDPVAVVAGDFNGDGKLDLASVAIGTGSGVSVLIGNGDGTFQNQVQYPVGTTPQAILAADFNGDNKLDLAVTNNGSNTVSVLIGNGDGTFQAHGDYPTGVNPAPLASGDFNSDGKLDLAVANLASNSISIFQGNGDGTFQPRVDVSMGTFPSAIAAGDFNGTGTLGLVVASETSKSLSILLQTTVTFSPATLSFPVRTIGSKSIPNTTTLTNVSSTTLNVTNVSITGTNAGDFSQTNTCGTVAPGGTCTISVTFSPTTENTRTAAVSITDNAPASPQSVILTGQGTFVRLLPGALNFGSVKVGQISPPQTVAFINTSKSNINISKVIVGGSNPNDFLVENTCGMLVKPATRCTFVVNFIPTKTGPRKAIVTINDTGGGTSQQFVVSGTGT